MSIINQILQIGLIGAAATTKDFDAKFMVEPEHIAPPVVQVVLVEDGGSIELAMV